MQDSPQSRLAAWFAGPKAENGDWFADEIGRIVQDYYAWRRNYFPQDGVVIDSALRRHNEAFRDAFGDKLLELLARLKDDLPFYSPRYAAHMLSEQSLPAIAGYFAAMLYNPNNVTSEAAPVTVRLELEAAQLIARMLGYGPDCWAHLTSGGTAANIEAMWIARTVKYLPLVVRDIRRDLGLAVGPAMGPANGAAPLRAIAGGPGAALQSLAAVFADAAAKYGPGEATTRRVVRAYQGSEHNCVERGLSPLLGALGSRPVVLVPETHHYCFEKAMDVLGLGRRGLIVVGVDSEFRMRVDDLEAKLTEAEGRGEHVLAVVAVAGSTEEGAIDPVDEILDLRARREAAGRPSFWVHADAAYGGYLRTMTVPARMGLGPPTAEVRIGAAAREVPLKLPTQPTCGALERLGECDSITIDPHKLGYIPYPAGAVCFKSNLVKPVARQDAPYIEDMPGDAEAERKSEGIGVYILEGSKPGAAAAAVWLSHTLIPLDSTGHGVLMQATIRSACELHALLEQYPDLAPGQRVRAVPLCPPGSNIVCYAFRPVDRAIALEALNAANRRIYGRFNVRPGEHVYEQSFFISRTTIAASQYSTGAVGRFLRELGVSEAEYAARGVFLLRSVLMNPWYAQAKARGRYVLSELAADLYRVAEEELASVC